MFNVSVNDKKNIYRSKPVMNVDTVPKPLTYDYMPEGYPKKGGLWSIEWDGNTEGLTHVSFREDLGFYKISDFLPTDDEFIGATLEISDGSSIEIASNMIENSLYPGITLVGDNIAIVRQDNSSINDITFSEKGAYFPYGRGLYAKKLSGEHITPISEEFLPLNIVKAIDAIGEAVGTVGAAADTADTALTIADTAQNMATNAQTTANTAKNMATNAQTTANTAKSTADTANSTANTAKSTANTALDKAVIAQSDAGAAKSDAGAAKSTADIAKERADAAKAAVDKALIVSSDGKISAPIEGMKAGTYQSLSLTSKNMYHQTRFAVAEYTGLEILVDRDGGLQSSTTNPSTVKFMSNGGASVQLSGINALIMSPYNSTKKFKITVDDSGTLSATEVT